MHSCTAVDGGWVISRNLGVWLADDTRRRRSRQL